VKSSREKVPSWRADERHLHRIVENVDTGRGGALLGIKAGQFFTAAGPSRSSRKIIMLHDALGKAWMRQVISAQDYSAPRRYALHWVAGGLQGPLGSVDLNCWRPPTRQSRWRALPC
jgi:hypothetical protein